MGGGLLFIFFTVYGVRLSAYGKTAGRGEAGPPHEASRHAARLRLRLRASVVAEVFAEATNMERMKVVLGHLSGSWQPRLWAPSPCRASVSGPDDVVVVHGRRTAIARSKRGGFKVNPRPDNPPSPKLDAFRLQIPSSPASRPLPGSGSPATSAGARGWGRFFS